MTVHVIYETHAISTDNETGIATGWLPGRLSDTGRRLARDLGARRRDSAIAAVFTSDLTRAVETAQIAFEGSSILIFQDSRLRECNYGDLKGAPVAEVAAVRRRYIAEPFPNGQSYRDVVNQTRDFLDDLARDWTDRTLLIIAHSANRWALEYLLNGIPLEDLVDAPFNWQEGWHYELPVLEDPHPLPPRPRTGEGETTMLS